MSQENVERIRELGEAYIRGDLQTVAESCDDDFEFTSVLTAVEETSYRGKDAWASYRADMPRPGRSGSSKTWSSSTAATTELP